MAVTYSAKSAVARGIGAIDVSIPSGYAEGDLLVLVIMGKDALPALPDGWTSINTGNNSTNVYNRTCYKIVGESESTLTVADSGTYTAGAMFLFKGNDTTDPINVSGTSTSSGNAWSYFTASGVTTDADDCLIVHASAFINSIGFNNTSNFYDYPTGTKYPINANLTDLTERCDEFYWNYPGSGTYGGIYLVTGTKESAGASGDTTTFYEADGNYVASVNFAIQPPSVAPAPEGGSDSTVIVSAQGSGTSIRQGGSSSSVVASAQGSGTAIRQGSSGSTVNVSAQGAGVTIRLGSASSTVIVSVQGAGAKIGSGGSSPTVVISAEGDGEVIVTIVEGGSESTVIVSVQGSGSVIRQGVASSTVIISAQGSGVSIRQSGSSAAVTVSSQGSGAKTASGASESPVTVDVEADGTKTGQGGAEPSVIVSVEGGGYGIGLIKSGGSETTVIVSSDGHGSKLASGASESTVIVMVEGFGTDYAPLIMTAVFAQPKLTVTFNPSAAMAGMFKYQTEQTATFGEQPELSAAFCPTVLMGGDYGNS